MVNRTINRCGFSDPNYIIILDIFTTGVNMNMSSDLEHIFEVGQLVDAFDF